MGNANSGDPDQTVILMQVLKYIGLDSLLASGDNFGTNNVCPDQAQQRVKLI